MIGECDSVSFKKGTQIWSARSEDRGDPNASRLALRARTVDSGTQMRTQEIQILLRTNITESHRQHKHSTEIFRSTRYGKYRISKHVQSRTCISIDDYYRSSFAALTNSLILSKLCTPFSSTPLLTSTPTT